VRASTRRRHVSRLGCLVAKWGDVAGGKARGEEVKTESSANPVKDAGGREAPGHGGQRAACTPSPNGFFQSGPWRLPAGGVRLLEIAPGCRTMQPNIPAWCRVPTPFLERDPSFAGGAGDNIRWAVRRQHHLHPSILFASSQLFVTIHCMQQMHTSAVKLLAGLVHPASAQMSASAPCASSRRVAVRRPPTRHAPTRARDATPICGAPQDSCARSYREDHRERSTAAY
jgi:hypothetical protein